jgi:hypothetical protein
MIKETVQEKKYFKLIVSPFLRESDITFDNQPERIDIQMENIKKFLNFLIKIRDIEFTDTQIRYNLKNIYNFFEQNNSIIIYYADNNQNYKYTFDMDNTVGEIYFTSKKINSQYYTYSTTNPPRNRQFDSLYIENIKIFHGIEKPEKSNTEKYSRWCEPFSKKNTIAKNKTCYV